MSILKRMTIYSLFAPLLFIPSFAQHFLGAFSGSVLQVDTQIESPAQNNNVQTLPEQKTGDTIQFQLFVPAGAGRSTNGYAVVFELPGKTFSSYIGNISGRDWTGATLSNTGAAELSALHVTSVSIPSTGYLGQVNLQVRRSLEKGATLIVKSLEITSGNDIDMLNVSNAIISFTTPTGPGDFDENGTVDVQDFLLFVRVFGKRSSDVGFNARMDLDGDGRIHLADFLEFIKVFGKTYSTGGGGGGSSPDLIVESPSVSNSSPNAGQSFTLSATVRNQGNGQSASTTLRYYRSSDATISTSDTSVGTDIVSGLSASGTSAESISLTAPSSAGTYYYGACVDPVSGESSTGNNCSRAVSVTVASVTPPPTTEGSKLYWTDWGTDKIQRANLDGSGIEDLVTSGLNGPDGLSLDMVGGKMYWTDAGTAKIQRANLNSSGVEDLVSGLGIPYGLALDVAGGKMYWTDRQTNKIQRANLNGSGVEDLVTSGLTFPGGVALDVAGGKMYWTNSGARKIQRANLDGSGIEDLVTSGVRSPTGIALNVAGGKMYWTDRGTDKIQRANLNGSNVEDLVTSGLNSPNGLALDVAGNKMYWADTGTNKVQRANLNGSGVEDLVTSVNGLVDPSGLTVGIGASSGGGGGGGQGSSPDLVVESPSVSNSSPNAGSSFTLRATVRNQGNDQSASTTLRYYRSSDATISTSDTQEGTDSVRGLSASGTSPESIRLTAPSSAGTYYYGACVESVSGESNTGNNCSSAVQVTVGAAPAPDLVVESPSVSNSSPNAGASFTLSATVRNQGNGQSASTTLRYYRSSDATISTGDTQEGTDGVRSLSASGTSPESISLTVPSSAGTYYYGACVESVSGESNTGNNCSSAVSVTVASVAPPPPPPTTGTSKLYWTDWGTDKIQRANLDGSSAEDLVTSGLDGPTGLALDMTGGKMYWTDAGTNKIQRANLDGSSAEDLYTTSASLEIPYGIALDVAGGKMYWTVGGSANKIQRANLDGSGVEDLVTSGLTFPRGLALDVAGGKMYWANTSESKIQRANLDGLGVEDLVTSGLNRPTGIALDVAGGKMYWTDSRASKIQRANLNGSGVEDLVTSGLNSPNGLALDVAGGKMYWADIDANKVQRANLNGSGVEDLLTSSNGLVDPSGLAVGGVSGGSSSSGGGGSSGTTYGVGDALPNFPTGFFVPRRLTNASLESSGGRTVLSFNNGGIIELQDGTRYTCIATGGCSIESGRVTKGTFE